MAGRVVGGLVGRFVRGAAGHAGWTIGELVVVIGVTGILGAVVAPVMSDVVASAREMAAVRVVKGRLRAVRGEALLRSRGVAGRFVRRDEGVEFQLVVDGDGDGVRASDMASGVDRVLMEEALEVSLRVLRFGIAEDVAGIEPGDSALSGGGDPIRLGSGDMVSFGAEGSGSSGTVYLVGARGRQFAVRLYGVTGRVRAFVHRAGRWADL